MDTKKQKYRIKIPQNCTVFYCKKKNLITLIGPLSKKSLKLTLEIKLLQDKKLILITQLSVKKISNNEKKNIKALQGTATALIKQMIIETSSTMYQKLKLVGIGYRAFNVENFQNQLLMFKLGFSHLIYFKIPNNIKISCLKFTKIFVFGTSYQDVTQSVSFIQFQKLPEPYKGKGILRENEMIKLKEGKKV